MSPSWVISTPHPYRVTGTSRSTSAAAISSVLLLLKETYSFGTGLSCVGCWAFDLHLRQHAKTTLECGVRHRGYGLTFFHVHIDHMRSSLQTNGLKVPGDLLSSVVSCLLSSPILECLGYRNAYVRSAWSVPSWQPTVKQSNSQIKEILRLIPIGTLFSFIFPRKKSPGVVFFLTWTDL